jgi:hypothetical protein
MARKQATMKPKVQRDVRPTAGDGAPLIKAPLPPGTAHKSPVSEKVEVQAQKLIHEAGSCDAAKTAVDVAAERENAPDFQEDHFALRWGFASRADLRSASKPLSESDSVICWATELPNGRWIQWSKEDMSAAESYSSFDELREHLHVSPA